MTFVFVSNYFNHHQAPFAEAMDEKTEHNFIFIETEPVEEERLKLGWGGDKKPYYVLQSYLSPEAEEKCRRIISDADVVIWGSCPFSMVESRLRQRKFTFAYSERLFKGGYNGLAYWGRVIKYKLKLGRYQNSKHYLLCASAYAAEDYARIGLFKDKAYKWGYFPEVKKHNLDELFAKKHGNHIIKLLWVGRLIELKHPEAAIYVAEKLMSTGVDFELTIIGSGWLEPALRELITEKHLDDCVKMLGAMSPEKVREHMETADIYLFTSDQNEGWGAVLNEAMNSACAVVASHAIGSVPYLIKEGKNGLTYHSGNLSELNDCVCRLTEASDLRERLGRNAYKTVYEDWSASVAAERLIRLSETLKAFPEGICSRA